MRNLSLLLFFFIFALTLKAQSDSVLPKPSPRVYTHRDSVYLAKLNSNGNLMIAAGVGLCGAGGYLIYQGVKVLGAPITTTANAGEAEKERNKRQGTIYCAAAGVGIAAGIVLTALGARNKVDFKRQKKRMELQSGILDNGNIGVALNF